ncbi:MAG: DUF6132 family protein [Holophaga sp.]|jgi:hypothetical protein
MGVLIAKRLVLGILIGGGLGFAYQKVVGCGTGTCPLTATPVRAVLYGAFMGSLWALAGAHP